MHLHPPRISLARRWQAHAQLLLVLILYGCDKPAGVGTVQGWKPVYASTAEYRTIRSMPPRSIQYAGKIAYAANRIFMVERGQGVHVVSYAIPASPVKERFIEVPGCYELTWRNGYLIANNGPDLVTIDISLPGSVAVVSRLPGVFRSIQETVSVPPDAAAGDYFECPDPVRGVILRWEKTALTDPSCQRVP